MAKEDLTKLACYSLTRCRARYVTDNQGLWNTTTKVEPVLYKTDLNKDGTVNILGITIAAKAYNTARTIWSTAV